MQGAALVVFTTDHLIIAHVLGPQQVPAYHIAYRYFNFAAVFFGLISGPFWSAFTEAYAKGEKAWIYGALKSLRLTWLALAALCLMMLVVAPWVYPLWVGTKIQIPALLSAAMCAWVVASMGLSIYGTLLNGIGVVRLSMLHSVVVMLLNIPLSIWLAQQAGLRSAGVILASLFGLSLRLLFQPRQVQLLLEGRATGWWAK